MPKKSSSSVDKFINRTQAQIIMSAANTLTFQQIRFASGIFEGVALILNRILWNPTSTSLREIVAATDTLIMALTTRNDLTTLVPSNLSVLAQKEVVGLGAAVESKEIPFITDYSTLPGGGLLIPANPLYIGADSGGFVNPATINITLEYQWKKLSKDESIELLQTLLPGTV